jgi:hypothetical protein
VKIAVIRDRDGGHLQFGGTLRQRPNLDRPVEQAVIRVQMQVNKLFTHNRLTALSKQIIKLIALTTEGLMLKTYSHSIVLGGLELMS